MDTRVQVPHAAFFVLEICSSDHYSACVVADSALILRKVAHCLMALLMIIRWHRCCVYFRKALFSVIKNYYMFWALISLSQIINGISFLFKQWVFSHKVTVRVYLLWWKSWKLCICMIYGRPNRKACLAVNLLILLLLLLLVTFNSTKCRRQLSKGIVLLCLLIDKRTYFASKSLKMASTAIYFFSWSISILLCLLLWLRK